MNILMFSNLYYPLVGGIQRSIASFAAELRQRGHRVMTVTPEVREPDEGFEPAPDEAQVLRVPAIQHFSGTKFSVALPVTADLRRKIEQFEPTLIHSHHPFLLGDAAVRFAAAHSCPLVFTHHTMWEHHAHYTPSDTEYVRALLSRIATEYANLCDHVITPSGSVGEILRERGVETPLSVVPTGIDPAKFTEGDGASARQKHGLPADAPVVGHVGRLNEEKNLTFLAAAIAEFLQQTPAAHALVVGNGALRDSIGEIATAAGVRDRLHLPGVLTGQELADAYHAMNLFAFASLSETQGMVVTEAMTAGLPVVALDAPGVSDVIRDGENGRLLPAGDTGAFVAALREIAEADQNRRAKLVQAARETAAEFSPERCTDRLEGVYAQTLASAPRDRVEDDSRWDQFVRQIKSEWDLWRTRAEAMVRAISEQP